MILARPARGWPCQAKRWPARSRRESSVSSNSWVISSQRIETRESQYGEECTVWYLMRLAEQSHEMMKAPGGCEVDAKFNASSALGLMLDQ